MKAIKLNGIENRNIMNDNLNTDSFIKEEYQKILKYLKNTFDFSDHEETTKAFIQQISLFQKFSTTNKTTFYVLWNQAKFLPIYVSDNIIYSGYSPQDLYNMNLFTAMKRVYWKQIPWVYKLHKDRRYFRKLTGFSSVKNYECFYCGMKLKDKWGNVKAYSAKQKFLTTDNKGTPLLSFMEVEDITSIFKGDKGWCRYIDYSKSIPIKRVFFSNGSRTNELLTNREIGILKLIAQNNNSTTIANQLKVSVETIKKHRKNMIAKVGAKDMTALIYLCQQANVI